MATVESEENKLEAMTEREEKAAGQEKETEVHAQNITWSHGTDGVVSMLCGPNHMHTHGQEITPKPRMVFLQGGRMIRP